MSTRRYREGGGSIKSPEGDLQGAPLAGALLETKPKASSMEPPPPSATSFPAYKKNSEPKVFFLLAIGLSRMVQDAVFFAPKLYRGTASGRKNGKHKSFSDTVRYCVAGLYEILVFRNVNLYIDNFCALLRRYRYYSASVASIAASTASSTVASAAGAYSS